MAHEVESMAFAHAVPWHGLGNRVDANVSVEEMVEQAGINWRVEKRPLWCSAIDKEGKTLLKDGKPTGLIKVPGRFALVRSTDHKVLSLTGDQWRPLQNVDMMNFFRKYAEAGKITLETAGSLRGGKVIWALANLNHSFDAAKKDKVRGYLLFISPHEVGKRIAVYTTAIRVVCANTMALALGEGLVTYGQNHLSDFNVENAQAAVEQAHEQLRNAEKEAKLLMKLKLSDTDAVAFLAQFLQPMKESDADASEKLDRSARLLDPANWNKKLSEVVTSMNEAPGAVPGTGWGVLQGVTYWADHVAGRNAEARLAKSWLGERGELKQKVNAALLQLVA